MTDIWIFYPLYVEETMSLSNTILDLIKRVSREYSDLLKLSCYQILFKLLDLFAQDRNPYAAVVYKKLTFSLMEEHQNLELRDFMLRNFMVIFEKYQSIPAEILLEPLIK